MATIFRCDKCDSESRGATALRKVTIEKPGMFEPPTEKPGSFELCERCVARLRSWLEPDAKEAAAPVDRPTSVANGVL